MEKIIDIIDGMKWEITIEPISWAERLQGMDALMKKYIIVSGPSPRWFLPDMLYRIVETKCLTNTIDDFCENLEPEFVSLELKLTNLIKEIEEKYKQFGLYVAVRADNLPDNKKLRLFKIWASKKVIAKIQTQSYATSENQPTPPETHIRNHNKITLSMPDEFSRKDIDFICLIIERSGVNSVMAGDTIFKKIESVVEKEMNSAHVTFASIKPNLMRDPGARCLLTNGIIFHSSRILVGKIDDNEITDDEGKITILISP